MRCLATITHEKCGLADELDIEVAVLVEINTQSAHWATLRSRLEQRGYGFVEGSRGDQRIVIAFEQKEVQLSGSFFTVIGIHLKSGFVATNRGN